MPRPPPRRLLAAFLLASLSGGCGSGTIGVVTAIGGSGGSASAPTQVTAFRVGTPSENCDIDAAPPKVPPALIRFTLNKGAHVSFCYETADDLGHRIPLTALLQCEQKTPVENPSLFDAGPQSLLWHFDEEPGLDLGLTTGVRVCALLSATDSLDDGNSTRIDIGNDPPRILAPRILNQAPDGEVAGDAPIRFLVTDSSQDIVNVFVDYAVDEGGSPTFRPAKDIAQSTTTVPAISGVQARSEENGGTEITFIWDSDAEPDLRGQELPVLVRLTPQDPVATGEPLLIPGSILIDNNLPPTVILDRTSLEITRDDRGGIPVPFRIRDPEGDPVTVVLQWAPPGTPFPDLPDDPAVIASILSRPDARRRFQIASELPVFATGRTARPPPGSSADDAVRLPELATSAAWLVNAGGPGPLITNRPLEILRPSLIPIPLYVVLTNPIASLPLPDGLDALVLTRTSSRRWSLVRVVLATEEITPVFASEAASGDLAAIRVEAMAFDPLNRGPLQVIGFSEDHGERRLLGLRLRESEAAGLEVTSIDLLARWKSDPGDEVHGLASGDGGVSWVTTGDSVLTLHHARGSAEGFASTLVSGLRSPRGLCVDALSQRLFVAEKGSDRILRIDPQSSTRAVLAEGVDLSQPDAICLDGPNRLLVVTDDDPDDRTFELRAIPLRLADPGPTSGIFTVTAGLEGTVESLACGSDSLRLITVSEEKEQCVVGRLVVGGGVLERRRIESYDPASQVITVSPPFSAPRDGLAWRISDSGSTVLPHEGEISDVFVWDSREHEGDRFELRLTAVDSDTGSSDLSAGSVPRRLAFEVEPTLLFRTVDPNDPRVLFPEDLVVDDLDGDGDLDLATANVSDGRVTVFYQTGVRDFTSSQLDIDAASATQLPRSLAAADLDGDALQDLVLASCTAPFASLLRQSPIPRTWHTSTLVGFEPADCPSTLFGSPIRIVTADVNGDSLCDLVFVVPHEQRLSFLLQIPGAPSTFAPPSDLDLGADPLSVEMADIDRDGGPDALVAIPGGLLLVTRLADPAPTITPLSLSPSSEVRAVQSASFDDDALPDLAVLVNAAGASAIVILHQRVDGDFDPEDDGTRVVLPIRDAMGRDLFAVDLDVDGDSDLVFAADGKVGVFFQESGGAFSESARVEFVCGGPCDPLSLEVQDVDGDGILDVLVAVRDGSRINILWGRSCSDLSASRVTTLQGDAETVRLPQTLVTADLDGDGDLECAVPSALLDRVAVFRQVSPGRFDDEAVTLDLQPGAAPLYIEAGDVNGDGRADLVTGNSGTDSVTLFIQTPQGGLERATTLTSADIRTMTDLELADVDGDGRLDIAVSSLGRGSQQDFVGVFLQEAGDEGAPPRFGPLHPLPATLGDSGPAEVRFVDLDLDGALDLVTSNRSTDTVEVFRQVDGIFARTSVLTAELRLDRLAVGHFDEDDLPDLVVAGRSTTPGQVTVVVWRQRHGDPLSFEGGDAQEFPGSLVAFDLGDIDCDGRDDVALATGGPDAFFLLLRRTPFSFQRVSAPIEVGPDLTAFRLDDVDGDAEPDVVSLSMSRGAVDITFGSR